jgi:hypothetical protein
MKIGLKADHKDYHTFDMTYTKQAISLIKEPADKPNCLFSRSKQESTYERSSSIAIGAMRLIPSILFDLTIRMPINLTVRNVAVLLLNNRYQAANNQRKIVKFVNFTKRHSLVTKTILILAATIALSGVCYYNFLYQVKGVDPK